MILLLCDFWIIISSIGCFLSGIFTISLFFVGRKQIKKYISLGELDLYNKLKGDYNSSNSQNLLECILDNTLGVNVINNDVPKLYHISTYVNFRTDLLDHIEDTHLFLKKGLISEKMIIEGYGLIIIKTYESEIIKLYIEKVRTFYKDQELYSGIKKLYLQIKK